MAMHRLAVIGGTGLPGLDMLQVDEHRMLQTPFGKPSGPLVLGRLNQREVVFLARHGEAHTIPPHRVNYRANLWALHHLGVRRILAVAAVGGIRYDMSPGTLAIPDQLIDYTWGRCQTFFEEDLPEVIHVDFTQPYSATVREAWLVAARHAALEVGPTATYGVTQGPRLETAAEIDRLERDGCHIVGMTGMPEAALARELELEYAACAVVANWAAGRGEGAITLSGMQRDLHEGMSRVAQLLPYAVTLV